MIIPRESLSPDPRLFWSREGITLPGNVLSAGMLPSVLMRERTPHQSTSVRVLLNTGNEYTVEILKIGVVSDQSC